MSIILVALHTSGDIEKRKVPKGFLTFPVEAKLTGHDKKMTALAITDGVASDRFFCFSDDELGRDGTVLRKALFLFLNSTKQESGHLFDMNMLDEALKAIESGKQVAFGLDNNLVV